MKKRTYKLSKLLKSSDEDIVKTLDSLFRRKTDYFLRSIWNDPKRSITKTITKESKSITIKLWDWDDVYIVTVNESTIVLVHDNKFHGKTSKPIFGESEESTECGDSDIDNDCEDEDSDD